MMKYEDKSYQIMRLALVIMFVVTLVLAGTGTAWAIGPQASSPCPGGGACCITHESCGWCHSNWCPGGYGVLYKGYMKTCYDANENQTSFDMWCGNIPCGVGACQ